jgi:hypothetical protein
MYLNYDCLYSPLDFKLNKQWVDCAMNLTPFKLYNATSSQSLPVTQSGREMNPAYKNLPQDEFHWQTTQPAPERLHSPFQKGQSAKAASLYFQGTPNSSRMSRETSYALSDEMDYVYDDEHSSPVGVAGSSKASFRNSKNAQYRKPFLKVYDQCKAANPKITYQNVVDQFNQLPAFNGANLEVSTVKEWITDHKKAHGQHVTQRNTVENAKLRGPFLAFYDQYTEKNPKAPVSEVIKQFNRANKTNLIGGTVGRWVIIHKKAKGKTVSKHNHLNSFLFKDSFLAFYDACTAIDAKLSVPALVKQFNENNAFLGANLKPGTVSNWVTEHKRQTGQEIKSYNQFGEASLRNLFLVYYEECKAEDPHISVSTVVQQLNERNAQRFAQLDPITAQENAFLDTQINPKTAQSWITDYKKQTGQEIQHHDHVGSALFKLPFLAFHAKSSAENDQAAMWEIVQQFNQENESQGANINPGTAQGWLNESRNAPVEQTDVQPRNHLKGALFKTPFLAFYDACMALNPEAAVPAIVDEFNRNNAFLGADLKHGVARNWVTDHKKMTGQTVRSVDYQGSSAFKNHFLSFYTHCAAINPYIAVSKVVDEFNQRNAFLGANVNPDTAHGWVTQHKRTTGQETQTRNFVTAELFRDDFLAFYDACVAKHEKISVPQVVELFNKENEYRSTNLKAETASPWVTERNQISGEAKQPDHIGNALMKQPFRTFYTTSIALDSKVSVEEVVKRFNRLDPTQRYYSESGDIDLSTLDLQHFQDLKLTTARKWVTAYKKEMKAKSRPVSPV